MVTPPQKKDNQLVEEIARAMLARFGDSTAAVSAAIERRCEKAGDLERAGIMRQVRRRVATGHLVDVVA